MKPIFYFLSFTFLHLSNNQDKQIEFAKTEFENLQKSNFEGLDKKYLTKEEFLDISNKIKPTAPEKNQKREIAAFEDKKNLFLKNYKNTLSPFNLSLAKCDSMRMDLAQIDSVRYAYKIVRPISRDTTIHWPASQTYRIKDDDFTINFSVVYFSDENGSYAMQIESVYYNKEWRYFHSVKSPRIVRIK